MRATLTITALLVVALTVLNSALASAPPRRTPDAAAIPMLDQAKISLVDGIQQVQAKYGPAIEAKFELDDSGALSLSVYPAAKGLRYDAEFNKVEEASGSPTGTAWKPEIEVFK